MGPGRLLHALSMAFGATLLAPHGGVFVIGLIGNRPLYLLAIAIGTVVTAAEVILLKSTAQRGSVEGSDAPDTTTTEVARA